MPTEEYIKPGMVTPQMAAALQSGFGTSMQAKDDLMNLPRDMPEDTLPVKLTAVDGSGLYSWTLQYKDTTNARVNHPNGRTGTPTKNPAYFAGGTISSFPTECWIRRFGWDSTKGGTLYEVIAAPQSSSEIPDLDPLGAAGNTLIPVGTTVVGSTLAVPIGMHRYDAVILTDVTGIAGASDAALIYLLAQSGGSGTVTFTQSSDHVWQKHFGQYTRYDYNRVVFYAEVENDTIDFEVSLNLQESPAASTVNFVGNGFSYLLRYKLR